MKKSPGNGAFHILGKMFSAPFSITAAAILLASAGCASAPSPTSRCWVQLFAGTGFDPRQPHDIIFGPGAWPVLDRLPNARLTDWGGKVESLITGPEGRLFVWAGENFTGSQAEVGPGKLCADRQAEGLSPIRSLRLECIR